MLRLDYKLHFLNKFLVFLYLLDSVGNTKKNSENFERLLEVMKVHRNHIVIGVIVVIVVVAVVCGLVFGLGSSDNDSSPEIEVFCLFQFKKN